MFPFAEEPGASRFRVMQLSTTDHVPWRGVREGRRKHGYNKIKKFHYAVQTLASFHKIIERNFHMLLVHYMNTIKKIRTLAI